MVICKEFGCPQISYLKNELCYYHNKKRLGLIKNSDFSYFKSTNEVDCVLGKREPNWELAQKELPRIKRICNNVNRWAKIPLSELIQESLIVVATVPITAKKFKHYLNVSIHGVLKNFVAEFHNVVSLYWKPFFKRISDQFIYDIDNLSDSENLQPDKLLTDKEQNKILRLTLMKFQKMLGKNERIIFFHRILKQNKTPIRILSKKLNFSRSTINRWEHELIKEFKEYFKK